MGGAHALPSVIRSFSRRERQEANVGTTPSRVLNGRALVAAARAPRPLPQHVARRVAAQRMTATAHASGA